MTEKPTHGPDSRDLTANGDEEDTENIPLVPEVRKDSDRTRSEFYQRIRRDVPSGDADLRRHADLEAEHGRTYEND